METRKLMSDADRPRYRLHALDERMKHQFRVECC